MTKKGKNIGQATKVMLAGSLAMTGVLGANVVESLNVGEGTLNTVQAAELDMSELKGVESATISVSKSDGTTDPYNFTNSNAKVEVELKIDPDNVELGTFNPIRVDAQFDTESDGKRGIFSSNLIPPAGDIVMGGVTVGTITSNGFIFNENIRQINDPTITFTKELTLSQVLFADEEGVKDIPVQLMVSEEFGTQNYAVLSNEIMSVDFPIKQVKPSEEEMRAEAVKGFDLTSSTTSSVALDPESSALLLSKYITLGTDTIKEIEGPIQYKITLPEHVKMDETFHTVPSRVGEEGKVYATGNSDTYVNKVIGAEGVNLKSSLASLVHTQIIKTGENTYILEVNKSPRWDDNVNDNLTISGRLPLIIDPQGYEMTKETERKYVFKHGDIKVEMLNPGYEEEKVHDTQVRTITASQVGGFEWAFNADGTRNTPPRIITEDLQIPQGVPFSEADALNSVTAEDDYDGDLTEDIVVVSNDVDTSKRGTYTIVYQVEDSRGFKVQHERTVRVMGTTAPVLVAYDQYVLQGSEYDPLKNVDALDYQDGELAQLNNEITVKGTVDTSKPGVYPLTYSVTDDEGETTTRTINVTVGADYGALLAEIEQKIEDLEGADEAILKELGELRDSIRVEIDNITNLLVKQEELINQNIVNIEQLEQNQTEIQNNITTINETITTVQTDINNLKTSITELEQKDIEQDARLDELEKSVTDLEGEIGKLKEEDTIINNYLTEITEIINNLPEGYDDTELREKVTQLEKDKEDLQKQITDGNKALEDLTEVVNNIKEYDDTEIQNRLDVVNEIVVNLGDRVTNNETLIKEIMEILNNLKEYDDTELRDLIASLEQEQTVMNEYITNLETTINNLTTIINNLPDEYDDSALQDRINQLEEELAKVTADREADKKALEDLTEVVNNIEEYDDTEIQKRVDAVTERTTNVEERVTETETLIQEILDALNNLPEYEEYDDTEVRESIRVLEELLKQYQDINSTNETKIKELEQLITDLVNTNKDTNLQEQIDELKNQHQAMLDKLAELEEGKEGTEPTEPGDTEGVSEEQLQELLDKIAKLEEAIKQLEESVSNIDIDINVEVNTGESGKEDNGKEDNEPNEPNEEDEGSTGGSEPTDKGEEKEPATEIESGAGASDNGVVDIIVGGELVDLEDPTIEEEVEDVESTEDEVESSVILTDEEQTMLGETNGEVPTEETDFEITTSGTDSDSNDSGSLFSRLPDTGIASAGTGLLATALLGIGTALGIRRKKGTNEEINEEQNEDKNE